MTGQDGERIPPGVDPDILHRVVTVEAVTENLEGMRHEASVRQFRFISDEPEEMTGTDQDPAPLDYFTAALGL
ncbi:MAG: hypothetical protein ACLFWM_03650 [Actinomycetota bacterium]